MKSSLAGFFLYNNYKRKIQCGQIFLYFCSLLLLSVSLCVKGNIYLLVYEIFQNTPTLNRKIQIKH